MDSTALITVMERSQIRAPSCTIHLADKMLDPEVDLLCSYSTQYYGASASLSLFGSKIDIDGKCTNSSGKIKVESVQGGGLVSRGNKPTNKP